MSNQQRPTAQIARTSELIITPLCEAVLIFVGGIAAWVTRQPMIFTSLGPTAFEMVETPDRKSAKPYNVLVGHSIGVAAGFAAMWLTGAWWAPPVSVGHIHITRVTAAVLACVLTVSGTMLARATQPAALSTTLLVALGRFQQPKDTAVIIAAITLMVVFGEPLRMWRDRNRQRRE